MFKFVRNVFVALVVAGSIIGVFWYIAQRPHSGNSAKNPEVLSASNSVPAVQALLVQVDTNNTRKVLSCAEAGCKVIAIPPSDGGDPVSDGSSWYRYVTQQGNNKASVTVLQKVHTDGSTEKISEENELVQPRGLIMSPDGARVAYFLDNIHDNQGLTELWVYDSARGGAQVVAENLKKENIASRVRWSASSRVAWFLQDGGQRQYIVVPTQGDGKPSARFSNIDWNKYSSIADQGVMDVSDDTVNVAFAEPTFFGFSQLTIAHDGGSTTKQSMKGNVVFVRWMQNNTLFYVVQDGNNLTFWIAGASGERPIARMPAQFRSAHSSGSSDLVAFIADPKKGETHLYVLQISTGLVRDETQVPSFSGNIFVVQANEAKVEQDAAVATITAHLTDQELLAFAHDRIMDIAQDPQAKIERMITTDTPNTIYIDYTSGSAAEKRVLIVVQDALHPAWQVLAHYMSVAGQWKRDEDAQDADPKPTKLYEWEQDVSEWILKQTY